MTNINQNFADKKLAALHDAWQLAKNPADPIWRQRWADAAEAARLPCFDDATGKDLGAAGWRSWAGAA